MQYRKENEDVDEDEDTDEANKQGGRDALVSPKG